MRRTWDHYAACKGEKTSLFFSDYPRDQKLALSICERCPVTEECLNFALANNCIGVWAGTSDRQRRKLRRGARQAGWSIGSSAAATSPSLR